MASSDRTPADVATTFQNTLTLLSAEIEGRSFGGGVHELVPSEIARLTTVVPVGAGEALASMDALARETDDDAIIEATDSYLVRRGAVPAELLPILREARALLSARRFERNRRTSGTSEQAPAEAA
jgi:hypothetical protein